MALTVVEEQVCLRFADAADAHALAALRAAALVELRVLDPLDAPAFRRRARDEMRVMLAQERLVTWVLVVDGRVAGCASVVFWDRLPYPGTSRHAELAGVYVEPAYRRRGYARELVGEALATARAAGVRRIVIAPAAHTVAFYRSFGFDDAGWLKAAPASSVR